MSQPATGSVTTIDSGYLTSLVNTQLQPLLDQVTALLNPSGQLGPANFAGSSPSILIPPVGNLKVEAGGTAGQSGSSNFDAANILNTELATMGASVEYELNWLRKVLTDMISEINTTITQMQKTDNLNSMDAETLAQDFSTAIADASSSPTSSSTSGGTSGGTSGSSTPG